MEQPLVSVKYSEEMNPFSSHFHDCHQLIYVVSGSASITVNGAVYAAAPGTLVLISRFETHAIRIESPDYSRYTAQISPNIYGYNAFLGDKLLSALVNRPARFQHAVDTSACPQVGDILRQMAAESENDAPMQDKMLLFLLSQLLVLFCRLCPECIPGNTGKLQLVQQIQRHIETNFASRWVLDDLAKQFHLSQSHLSHLFKQITGCSVIAYLTTYRIAAAKHYLAETDWEVGKIAGMCGFSDHSNFGRTFRTATGLSPTQFRNQYRG